MSITTGSANSARYVDFDEYVDLKLQKTRSTIKSTDLLVALAGVAAMFLGYLLVFVVLDQWVIPGGFGVVFRWMLLLTLVAATIAWLVAKVGLPYMWSVNRLYAAREIEKSDPSLKSNLLNLIDLRAAGREIAPSVMRTLERHAAVQLQQIDVTQAVDHRPLMRTATVLLAVIVMFCLYALFSPKDISNSIWRGLLPDADLKLATSTKILNVLPGDVTVVARTVNSRVEIIADLGGLIPEKVFVHYTTSDGKFRDEPVELRADAEGQTRFKGMLVGETGQGLLQDVTYVVRAGDAESKSFRITVEQPPSATPDKVRLEFPSYMKLEPTEQAGGQIESWEGVKVTLTAHTNIPVKSASIQFLDEPTAVPTGDDLPMTVSSDGRHLDAKWTLGFRSDGTSYSKHYRIQCKTVSGAEDPAPIVYGIAIRPDFAPEVALLEPVRDLEAPANATIPLLIQARDPDFELSHINLHVEKLGQSILKDSLSDTKQSRVLLKHDLALDRLALNTGDVIEFWVEAFDNKQPRSNRRNTPRLKVTIIEPISDKAAKKQLAEDRQQRDQRLVEAQREQNDEGRPGQPPQQEVAANDPPRDPQPNEQPDRDPMPRDNAQSSKDDAPGKDGKSGNEGQGNNPSNDQSPRDPASNSNSSEAADGKGKSSTKEDSSKPPTDGTKSDESKGGTNSRKSEQPTPLSPDGADDEKVIEKLVNKLNSREDSKQNNRKQDDPAQGTNEPTPDEKLPKPENAPATEPDPKNDGKQPARENGPKQKDSKNGTDSTEQQPPQPGAPKDDTSKPKEPMTKSDGSKPSETSNTDKPAANKPKPEAPKPGESSAKPNDPEKNGPGTKDDSLPDPTASKKNDNSKGPKGSDTPQNEVNEKSQTPADKGDMPDEATSPEKNNPDKNATNKEAPGKNADNKQPGAVEKKGPDSPPSKATPNKRPGDPDPNAPREPAPDSPDAKPQPGDGKEKGPVKPQPDPKVKPTTEKSDAPQRDLKDKPNTRPGDPKLEDAQPPTNDSTSPKPGENKSDKKPKPGKQPNEAAGDQPSNEPSEKEKSATSPPPKQDNTSPTANEPQPPLTKPDQKTNDSNNGGETGGEKPDTKGKPSKQKGPGEADKQPGTQQPNDSDSQPADDKQQPAQGAKPGKDGKPKTGDAPADSKPSDSVSGKPSSKANKPGAPGQPVDEPSAPGGDKGGDQGGDKPSPDNKAGQNKADKPAGLEPESDPPKAESQPGPADKGGDKPGDKGAGKSADAKGDSKSADGKPSDKSGKGSSQPGKMSSQGGASATPGKGGELPDAGEAQATALEEEAANLEYNKQATELVLKRLQKELERGDVDPELLEQLGWTEAEMKRFAERLGKHLEKNNANDETPESAARREQFEEMLKSLDLKKGGTKRTGENSPQREVNQIESRRTNVPPTYKKAFEQFTKDLNRQKQPKPASSSK